MEEKKLKRKKEQAIVDRNQEQVAIASSNLGDFYNQQGKYDEAVVEYKQESEIYKKLGRKLEMAKANRMVGEMYMLLSEFENALKHVSLYLTTVQELGNKVEEQRAYATLGRAHLLHGQSFNDAKGSQKPLKNAEKAFIKSLLICKELSGQISKIELLDMQARLYLNIGVVKEHLEDFDESISYMEKAIKISKTNDIYELLHLCYMSVSLLYHYKKNDSVMALKFCNLALEIANRLPNRTKKQCETLLIKSEVMIKEGDFQSAKQVLHKAYKLKTPDLNDQQTIERNLKIVAALCITLDQLVITELTNYEERKKLYEKMGDGCCLLQNFKKAIDYYLKMLENGKLCCKNDDKELIPIYISLYQTYKDDKQYDKSLEYLWKEYELNKDEPIEAFNTLCNIAEVYELQLKSFWTIYDIYQRAIDEARKSENRSNEKIVFMHLMKLEKKHNMHALLDNLKDEAKSRGIDLNEEGDDVNENSEEIAGEDENNTPDIGAEICLEDLTDSDSESENCEQLKKTRKRRTGLIVKRNNKGETQLHQACINGNLNLVRRLIDQGHPINIRDHAGWLPLHEACNHGYRDIVEVLLKCGGISTINDKGGTSCDGITPLYDACSNGYLDVAELLLEHGANATLKTDFGDTALNVLDKWRNTVELNHYEQLQYERVRSKLVDRLTKSGLIGQNMNVPITNENLIKSGDTIDDDSLEKLRRIAYESSDSEDSNNEEILKISRESKKSVKSNRYDDDSEEILEKRSRKESIISNDPNLEKNATNEYKIVMENLKHPNRKYSMNTLQEDDEKSQSKRRSGFLDPDEVDDDWLINDIPSVPNKKKRKYLNDQVFNQNEKRNEIVKYDNGRNSLNGLFDNDDDDDSKDAFQVLLESSGKQKNMKKSKPLNRNKTLSSKAQNTLIDIGFSRSRSISRTSSENSVRIEDHLEPDSTTIINLDSIQSTPKSTVPINSSTLTTSTVPFRVKVENELFLVPVDRKKIGELNIRWLAEEVSRRYYNIVGIKPVLRLLTIDGFAFEETDTLDVVLQENSITAKVLEWNITPLVQRYEEICMKLNMNINEDIKKTLENAQSTNNLIISDYSLTTKISEPIFKAIQHQSTLRILDLSNNFIQNDGCKLLSKSLSTLKQLKILNLQGNCITYEGINYLVLAINDNDLSTSTISSSSASLASSSYLLELEELCLNYNPLGDKSIEYLEKLCKQMIKLKKLHLSSCKLTNFNNKNLKFNDLIDIDISFNRFANDSIKFLLNNLNSCKLQSINLNWCIHDLTLQLGKFLLELFENGTCEQFKSISLQGCNLNDSDIYKFVEILSNSKYLEFLDLSLNHNLTSTSIQYIINKIPYLKNLHLKQCKNIADLYRIKNLNINYDEIRNSNQLIQNISLTIYKMRNDCDLSEIENALEQFWMMLHGDKAKIRIHNNNINLYV